MSDIEQQLLRLRASTRQMLREELELSPHRTLSVLADELLCESMYRRIAKRTHEPIDGAFKVYRVGELVNTPDQVLIERDKISFADDIIEAFDDLLKRGHWSEETHQYWKGKILYIRDGEGDG